MKVLFITNDALAAQMAGPAVRCLELARVVSKHHEVTIATAPPSRLSVEGITILDDAAHKQGELKAAAKESDVVISQGLVLARFPFVGKLAKHLVIDLYDAYLLEYLAHKHPQHPQWGYLRQWYRLNEQMLQGDFFLCSSERQWDYWLGRLCALGRLNPDEHQRDSSFRSLVGIVPFGLSAQPPVRTESVLRGIVPGVGSQDFLLLWAGGLWQWLDPLTVIRGVAEAAKQQPNIRLVFLGAQDPNPNNRPMSMAEESRSLARELGLLDKHVFFYPVWAPYEQRQNFLLEADVGISAHPASVESRYAFRTRVLDYIWAGLPMILSQGDYFGDFVVREVGPALPPGDVMAWKEAILALADNPDLRQEMRSRLQALAPRFYWEAVAAPLVEYCNQPYNTRRASRLRHKLVPFLSSGYDKFKR
ncbi:MAG: glycosyl transferase family 1 [Acidobacteria bacterium]|nr:MAG: glycosyl transferase family 1 [Acidobacteriota bacterium]